MIVLDEQLLGRGIETAISHWYPGAVTFLIDLRPHTVIKDDAAPILLKGQPEPTFVTINVTDFWQQVAITQQFCVVCVAVPDSRSDQVSGLLRRLLRRAEFHTKAKRMGCVVRITESSAAYYTAADRTVRNLEDW